MSPRPPRPTPFPYTTLFRSDRLRRIGHSGSIQPASRLDRDVVGPDGTHYARGTAVPHRADFNTLDNPFFWTARSEEHTSELQSLRHLVCRLLLEKKKTIIAN